jgi:hypothetical protein
MDCAAGAGHALFVLGCAPQIEHAGFELDKSEPKWRKKNTVATEITHGFEDLGAEVVTGLDDRVPVAARSIHNRKRVQCLGVERALLFPCSCCGVESDGLWRKARRRLQGELRAGGGQALREVEIGGSVGGGGVLHTT